MRPAKMARLVIALTVLTVLTVGVQVVPAAAVDTKTITVTDGYSAPVAGATVKAYTGTGSFEGITNAAGTVDVPLSAIVSEVSKVGYKTTFQPSEATVVLLAQCTLTGRLVDAAGNPIKNAEISTSYVDDNVDGYFTSTTAANGTFSLSAGAGRVKIWISSPGSALENGYFDKPSKGVGGAGTTLSPAAGQKLDLGDMKAGGTTYLDGRVFADDGVIEWDVPGAIGVIAYAYDPVAGSWSPCSYWMQANGVSVGDSFAGLWGLGAGTYRFAYTAYMWAPGAEAPVETEVFATVAGPSVSTVAAASSFTVETGKTLGLSFTAPAGTPAVVEVTPVAGNDRIATAIAASKLAYPDPLDDNFGTRSVVIATAYNWPDALGGSTLAGFCGGPLLLVGANTVPDVVLKEIARLGATNAYIVGGEGVVGPGVESALQAKLGAANVVRVWGKDRFMTANAVTKKIVEITDDPDLGLYDRPQLWDDTASKWRTLAFVATGSNFPDALAASPMAAGQLVPIFLAGPAGLSPETIKAMDAYGVTDVAILGGEGVVPKAVETSLNAKYGAEYVTRIGGKNRYDTAARVAEWAVSDAGFSYSPTWSGVAIATGTNFPDALAGGVLQGVRGSVILLTTPTALEPYTKAALAKHKYEIPSVAFLGGTGAVSGAVRAAVGQVLK